MGQKIDELVEVSLQERRHDYRTVVDSNGSKHSGVVILRLIGAVI